MFKKFSFKKLIIQKNLIILKVHKDVINHLLQLKDWRFYFFSGNKSLNIYKKDSYETQF